MEVSQMSELRPTKYLLKKLQELLLEYKKQLILAIVLLILSTFCLVYAPKLLGKIVNSILSYSCLLSFVPPVLSFSIWFMISEYSAVAIKFG